jgi:hypothetical protein
MSIIISETRIVEKIQQLANELNQTPEQIIAEAIEQFAPATTKTGKAFWKSIQGIGDSGDPDLAYRVKDILREEVDPIEGWSKSRDAEDPGRQ